MNPARLLPIALVLLLALSSVALSRGAGISGYTLKTNAAGCGSCHTSAAQNAVLTIKVPAAFKINEAKACTVLVAGSTTGIDIAVFRGSLAPLGTRTKAGTNGEIVHPSAGAGTYAFTYTAPATPGVDTLYATGVSGGFTGSWNHAPRFVITVSPLTGVDEQPAPAHFALAQNYPNPFNPSTMIEYSVPRTGNVTLTVFDLSGREVKTLIRGTQESGLHRVTFDGTGLASGVYLYRLSTESQTAIRKFVLLK
jgi:hypothetical protein